MTKTITLTLKEPDIKLPDHLKRPPDLDMNVVGFNNLEAMQMLLSAISGLLNNYKAQIDAQMTQMKLTKPD